MKEESGEKLVQRERDHPSTFPGITFHPRRRGFLRKETPRTGIVGWMTFNINYFALSTLSEIIFDDGTGRCLNGAGRVARVHAARHCIRYRPPGPGFQEVLQPKVLEEKRKK